MSNKFVEQGINNIPRPINYMQAMSPMINIVMGNTKPETNQQYNPGLLSGPHGLGVSGIPTGGVSRSVYPVTTSPQKSQSPTKPRQVR